MTIVANCSKFNHEVIISSDSSLLTFEIYSAVLKYLENKYGKDKVVFHGIQTKPSKNGLYFANIYLNTDKEAKEGASAW